MKYVTLDQLKPNMMLAMNLYDNHENILLPANSKLNKHYIHRIRQMQFPGLYVYEDGSMNDCKSMISEKTHIDIITSMKHIDLDDCMFLANQLTTEILDNPNLLMERLNLSSYDNYTYVHSINVAILSNLIGIGLHYREKELQLLSQAALLHDIGKTCIHYNIINKPGALNDKEFEIIKRHPLYGYNMTKSNPNISQIVRQAIWQHHENEDGTGYPRGLKSDDIHRFAKIIHVSDVYDALTSKRVYKNAINPSDAIEYIMSHTGSMFDAHVVSVFMQYVVPYHIGVTVQLSNGDTAIVQKNHKSCLYRPVVRTKHDTIDLMDTLNITITNIVT